MKKEVPIWEKSNLTIEEAAAYFNYIITSGAEHQRRLENMRLII